MALFEPKPKTFAEKHPGVVRAFYIACFLLVPVLLLIIGANLMWVTNPTEIVQKNITVSERQVFSRFIVTTCVVITPDNYWYQTLCDNTFGQLQPGHSYTVDVRVPVPRQLFYNQDVSPETSKVIRDLDTSTNMYRNEMIVSVVNEVS
jgi:hypothetical protein